MHDTRNHIIQVASRLFLQRNYEGVSILDITQAVGMTKGALYHHFASKEQLFEEVARQLILSYRTDFSRIPSDSLKNFYTSLAAEISTQENSNGNKESGVQLYGMNFYRLIWDALRILPNFWNSIEEFTKQETIAWNTVIQKAIDMGEIRTNLDATKIAKIFITVADGIGISNRMLTETSVATRMDVLDLWQALYQSLRP